MEHRRLDGPRRPGGDRIAPLIGARPSDVHVGDSTTVTLFKTLVAACRLRPGRDVVVLEPTTFPTDGYVAAGVARLLGLELRWCDPADPPAALDDDVAVLALTHVDFRTGAMFDLAGADRRRPRGRRAGRTGTCATPPARCRSTSPARTPTSPSAAPTSTSTAVPAHPPSPGSHPRHQDALRPADHRLVRARRARSRWTRDFAPADGHPPDGVRHPAGARAVRARRRARRVRRRRGRRPAGGVAVADRPLHRPGRRPARPGASRWSPRASTTAAAARCRCGTTQAYGVVQALIARGVVGDFRDPGRRPVRLRPALRHPRRRPNRVDRRWSRRPTRRTVRGVT